MTGLSAAQSPFNRLYPCWHADSWEYAAEGSVRDATTCTRGQAVAAFVSETGEDWASVGCWKRHIRALDRQRIYEWWVEGRTDEGWDGHPDEAPDGWDVTVALSDEACPTWEFVHHAHPEAWPVWIVGLRRDGAPPTAHRGGS